MVLYTHAEMNFKIEDLTTKKAKREIGGGCTGGG
jgi:hypothetical protein